MLRWVCFFSLAAFLPAHAADNDHWDDQFGGPGAESELLAVCANGSDVYVGGQFTTIGDARGLGIAKWDDTHWSNIGGGISGSIPIIFAIAA